VPRREEAVGVEEEISCDAGIVLMIWEVPPEIFKNMLLISNFLEINKL
jgi:hypothetical protein